MSPETEHAQAERARAAAAWLLAARQWAKVDSSDLDGSWAEVARRVAVIVAAAQSGAAAAGAAYVAASVDVVPAADVAPAAFSGVASDGRPLLSLLDVPLIVTKVALRRGWAPPDALDVGAASLRRIVRTQVADAGRLAAGVAITARPGVGWTRVVSVPCCQRCAVLAGKTFRWNDGFKRHPQCDCRHVPYLEADSDTAYTDSPAPDQIRDLTQAQRKAIADGADLNQVVNARRGRSGMTTTEGTSRRGYASYVTREIARQRGMKATEAVGRGSGGGRNVTRTRPRLTPEAIYRLSSDRSEALRLLKLNGYIVGDIRAVVASVA